WLMAIRIYPRYPQMHHDLATMYRAARRCDLAIPAYEAALALDSVLPLTRAGLIVCPFDLGRYRDARTHARAALLDGLDPVWFGARRATADSALAALDSLR